MALRKAVVSTWLRFPRKICYLRSTRTLVSTTMRPFVNSRRRGIPVADCTANFHLQGVCQRRLSSADATELSCSVGETDEPDSLYRAIDVYVKGHEDSVLESYSQFAVMAANELGIKVAGVLKPKMILDRVTLLRSVFVHKKHRAQYEAQTHKRVIQLKHLTGSTANAYISYLQINIPAGVAMEVHKWAIESLPRHLEEAMEDRQDQISEEDEEVAYKMSQKMSQTKSTSTSDYEEYPTTKPYLIGTAG